MLVFTDVALGTCLATQFLLCPLRQCSVCVCTGLRTLCYRGTKLPEEDIELLLKSSSPAPDAAGLVDIKQFVANVARQLQAGEKT